jgi:hypothetical protein
MLRVFSVAFWAFIVLTFGDAGALRDAARRAIAEVLGAP